MSGTSREFRDSHYRRRTGTQLRHAGGWAAAAMAMAALLAACGGSSGSASTPSSGSSSAPSATAAATQAAGGSMGCLVGSWRTDGISDPKLGLSGGAGGTLTVSSDGTFQVNYDGIQPMKFSYGGVKGSMQYSGQASGQLRVSGDKLSGVTRSSTFEVKSKINGVSFNLPLPKVTKGSTVPWQTFNCSGNTLKMINPPPAPSWNMSRTS